MKIVALTASLAFIALPAFAQPAANDPAAAATGLPADANYNSNDGVTFDTPAEVENDAVNGRIVDFCGQRNTNTGTMLSEQRHAMGDFMPAISRCR